MLDGLERDGLVARRACTRDRRVVRVALTARASSADERASATASSERRAELFAVARRRSERAQAARLLERLAAAIEDLRERAASPARRPSAEPTRTAPCSCWRRAALAYALAQTMVVPALPEIQRDLRRRRRRRDLAAHRLPAHRRRRHAAPRAPRGHVRQGAPAARRARRRSAPGNLVAALRRSLGVLIAGRAIQGAGGAIFPLAIGIMRDEFPREKVATGIGTISAMFGIGGGVGLVIAGVLVDQDRRRVDLLAQRWPRALSPRGPRGGTCPSRPCASRRGSTGSAPCCCRPALGTLLLGVSEGNAWGWTSARRRSGCSPAAVALAAVWVAGRTGRGPAGRPAASCAAARCGRRTSPRFAVGFAMFGVVHPHPATRADAPARRLRLRRVGHREPGCSCCPRALVMLFAGPLQRPAGGQARLEAPARARGRWSPPPSTSGSPSCTTRSSRSTSAASCSASASAWPSRRWPTSSSRPCPGTDRRGDGDQHDRALGRRRRRRAGGRGDRHGATVISGRRPTRPSPATRGVRDERRRARSSPCS